MVCLRNISVDTLHTGDTEDNNNNNNNNNNKGLYDLHLSPNIILAIKSRKLKWAVNVARIGEIRSVHTGFGRET
jgi:hypothetical protein